MKNLVQVTSLRLVRERSVEYANRIVSPENAFELLRPFMEDMAQEVFYVVGVDTKNRVNVIHQIGMGGVDGVTFSPGDVAKVLLLSNSTGCLIAHCHPSGEADPSPQDEILTKRIREMVELLGIRFLDHIVIGEGSFYSFANRS